MKEADNYGTGKNRTQSGKLRQRESPANHNPGEGDIRSGSGQGAATQKEERNKEKLRLNLGAGEKPLKNFINADLRPLETTDIVCDVRSLPFRESIFNFIIADDILEHVGRYECTPTLLEWHRILAVGGKIQIKVPNLHHIATRIVCKTIDGHEAARLIFATQDYPENLHKNGFTPDSLMRELQGVRFKGTTVTSLTGNDANNMEAVARK